MPQACPALVARVAFREKALKKCRAFMNTFEYSLPRTCCGENRTLSGVRGAS